MRKLALLNGLVILSLLVISCGGNAGTAPTATAPTATARPEIGYPAPDFTLTALDGTRVTLSALRGKPVFLRFWSVN